MSGEIYQPTKGFPEWVDSTEDETLVGEALALDIPAFALSSKNSCMKFVNTKKSLSAPQAI